MFLVNLSTSDEPLTAKDDAGVRNYLLKKSYKTQNTG